MITKYTKYLLLTFIGAVCMSTFCYDEPVTEDVKLINNSDKDIFVVMAPKSNEETEPNKPYTKHSYHPRYLGAGLAVTESIPTFEYDFYDEEDWYMFIIYPETVEKYTMKTVMSEGIYDDYILVSYQERVIDKKVIYNGKENN